MLDGGRERVIVTWRMAPMPCADGVVRLGPSVDRVLRVTDDVVSAVSLDDEPTARRLALYEELRKIAARSEARSMESKP
jgi:hypothetical protein